MGEQLEEVKSYLGVGRIGVGDGRRGGVVEDGGKPTEKGPIQPG